MKTKFLLPANFQPWGWVFFTFGFGLGAAGLLGGLEPTLLDVSVPDFFDYHLSLGSNNNAAEGTEKNWPPMINNNLLDEIALSMLLVGGLFLMLARRREEDEYIMKLRLEAILWAALFNAIIMLLAVWLIYDMAFFFVMISGLFFFYLLFIIRFQWSLWKLKSLQDEE